jgi:hypothetical protein
MNFVPKTARAANGTYATEAKGDIELDLGSWGRKVGKASITGPGKIGGHEFGYSLYGEIEIPTAITATCSPRTRCFPPHLTPTSPRACARIWRHLPEVQQRAEQRLEPRDAGPDQQRHLCHRAGLQPGYQWRRQDLAF